MDNPCLVLLVFSCSLIGNRDRVGVDILGSLVDGGFNLGCGLLIVSYCLSHDSGLLSGGSISLRD